MHTVDPRGVEMIRRREKNGFKYSYRSFCAEKTDTVPGVESINELIESNWWNSSYTITDFVNGHNSEPVPVETQLRIVYDDEALFCFCRMEEPCMNKAHALLTEQGVRKKKFKPNLSEVGEDSVLAYVIEKDDNFQLMIDCSNQRKRYIKFLINMAGVHFADEAEYNYGESAYPECDYLEPWDHPYKALAVQKEDSWYAAFSVPWKSMGINPDEAGVIGINAVRTRTAGEWSHHHLCKALTASALSAFDFGFLHLGERQVEITEVDLGRPVFEKNTFTAEIRNSSSDQIDLEARAECVIDATEEQNSLDSKGVSIKPDETGKVTLEYSIDVREPKTQTLKLSLVHKDSGKEAIALPFQLGHIARPIPAEYPWEFDKPCNNPSPEEEDFHREKLMYLLSRLPRFNRATTNDGAPSDFTLRSVCGTYEFNLMKSGVLVEIGDMLAGIFEDQADRLCGAVLLAHQDAFSLHMSPHVALHGEVTPLSALRLNAGHCYSRALVWLGIVQNMKISSGSERYEDRAKALLVMGHVIGAVETEDGEDLHIFDPTFGTFYFSKDNSRLATQKELCEDPGLVNRVMKRRLKDFVNIQCHRVTPAGSVVFPPLAPPE